MYSNIRKQEAAPANGGAVQGWNGSSLAPQRIGRRRGKNGMRDFSGKKEASADSKDGPSLRQKQFLQLKDHGHVNLKAKSKEEDEKVLHDKLYPEEERDTRDARYDVLDTMLSPAHRKASLSVLSLMHGSGRSTSLGMSNGWMESSGRMPSSRYGKPRRRASLSRLDSSSKSMQSQNESDYLHRNMSSLYMEELEQDQGVRIPVHSCCTNDHPPSFPHRMNGSSSRWSRKMNSYSSFPTRRHSIETSTITTLSEHSSNDSIYEEIVNRRSSFGVCAGAYVDSSGPRMPARKESISTMNDLSGSIGTYNRTDHRKQPSLAGSLEEEKSTTNISSQALSWIGESSEDQVESVLLQEDDSIDFESLNSSLSTIRTFSLQVSSCDNAPMFHFSFFSSLTSMPE